MKHEEAVANTLDLDPERGAIDLIENVEKAFAIKIANDEAERCWTVGDIYEVICARTPLWGEQGRSCASSAVFYRVRRSLAPEDRSSISPGSSLAGAGVSANRLITSLRSGTGLRFPMAEPTTVGVVGGWMFLVGFIGAIVALLVGAWLASAIGALVVAVGVVLLRLDPARLPSGVTTVGDLVRRTVPLNVQTLAKTGTRPPDRWSVLAALSAEHGTLQPNQIGPDTFLLRKGMELATARA